MKSPGFWNRGGSWQSRLLAPVADWYQGIVQRRIARPPLYASRLKVICIGNATMGGSGKTPVVQAVAHLLAGIGHRPGILLRGYGGREKGPLRINPDDHDARAVGDEALLHARLFPTVMSRDRVAGAKLLETLDVTHIVMDDGLQNPGLKKDLSFLVVDGDNPQGNGLVFPSGPLRETLDDAARRVQAIVVTGPDRMRIGAQYQFLCPVFQMQSIPVDGMRFAGRRVVAFAGIGRPAKFFNTLSACGARVLRAVSFADHHPFDADDMHRLRVAARRLRAILVTTRKDWVRLGAAWRKNIAVLDIVQNWADEEAVRDFLAARLGRFDGNRDNPISNTQQQGDNT